MLLRASLLALATITSLTTAALVSTPASARPVNIDWGDGRSVHQNGNHGTFCSGEHFRGRR